jgi:hypothetical protein
MSYSTRRVVNGQMCDHRASRFAAHLGGAFAYQNGPMTETDVAEIMADYANV